MSGGVQQRICPLRLAGVFVYPLAEAEVVSGFEAEAAGRRVSFQLQRRRSQATCCRALGPGLGTTTPRRCSQGESEPKPAPSKTNHSSSSCLPPVFFLLLPDIDFIFHPLIHPFIQQSWTAPDGDLVLEDSGPGRV